MGEIHPWAATQGVDPRPVRRKKGKIFPPLESILRRFDGSVYSVAAKKTAPRKSLLFALRGVLFALGKKNCKFSVVGTVFERMNLG